MNIKSDPRDELGIRSKNKFSYPHELIEKFKNYLNLEAINV